MVLNIYSSTSFDKKEEIDRASSKGSRTLFYPRLQGADVLENLVGLLIEERGHDVLLRVQNVVEPRLLFGQVGEEENLRVWKSGGKASFLEFHREKAVKKEKRI